MTSYLYFVMNLTYCKGFPLNIGTYIFGRICRISYTIEIPVFCKGCVSVFAVVSNTSSMSIQESPYSRESHSHSGITLKLPDMMYGKSEFC